jgi:hypothetical protein
LIVHAVTDARLVQTPDGNTRCVYPAGWADITAMLPITARSWLIELKTEDGAMRETQTDLHPEYLITGALVTIARSVEDVGRELRRQYALLNPKDLNEYLLKIRQHRANIAHRDARRKFEKQLQENRNRQAERREPTQPRLGE